MKKFVIYYSEFNIDSALAALILRESFNNHLELNILDIEMISYNRSTEFKTPTHYDTVFIVGPVFHSLHLEMLLSNNRDTLIIIYNVNNDLSYKENILSNIKIINSPIHEEDNTYQFKDLSTLVLSDLQFFETSKSHLATDSFKKFVASILKYKRFQVMTDVQELVFVHQCIELIKDSINNVTSINNIPLDNDVFYKENISIYNKHDRKIRSIINRNFALKTLYSGSTVLTAPVFNVSEEHAIAVMRLVSYSYDDVITYEDTATYRLYRIYTLKNHDWFIKCTKPQDHWMEGEVLLMKADIPTHETK